MSQTPASPPPSTSSASSATSVGRSRSRWIVVLFVAGILAVGAWVGTTAGRLAHRAPRAPGTRVAVLPPDIAAVPDARGLDLFVQLALERELVRAFAAAAGAGDAAARASHHVVPLPVVRSKLVQMERGRREGTLVDAAEVLDVARVITGRVTPVAGDGGGLALHLEVGPPGGGSPAVVDVPLPGQEPLAEVLAAVPGLLEKLTGTAGAAPAPPSARVDAFAAYVQGRALFDEGKLRDALERVREATDLDPAFADAAARRAITLALIRDRTPVEEQELQTAVTTAFALREGMAPVEQLLVTGLEAWSRFEVATDDAARATIGEEAFAAFRATTVRFPEERLGHVFLGKAYVTLMKGPTEALRHLEAARRLAPDWWPTTAELVGAWLALGDRKHATGEIRGYLVFKKDDPTARQLLQAIGEQ